MSTSKTTLKNEMRIIPKWAYFLAGVAFICFQVVVEVAVTRSPNPPPIPLRIFLRIVPGILIACVVLLIGYVNQDAKRRNMNRTLWTLLVMFIPNAIGFILYFLLRQPATVPCPQCGTLMQPSFNFCPNCKYNLHPTCPGCQHAVNPGDKYCPYCSHDLLAAQTKS